jgi:hypothetical protein
MFRQNVCTYQPSSQTVPYENLKCHVKSSKNKENSYLTFKNVLCVWAEHRMYEMQESIGCYCAQ